MGRMVMCESVGKEKGGQGCGCPVKGSQHRGGWDLESDLAVSFLMVKPPSQSHLTTKRTMSRFDPKDESERLDGERGQSAHHHSCSSSLACPRLVPFCLSTVIMYRWSIHMTNRGARRIIEETRRTDTHHFSSAVALGETAPQFHQESLLWTCVKRVFTS